MKKILAFAGSNSKTSINKQLAIYVASLADYTYDVVDLNDYDLPIFSLEVEANGIPELASDFNNLLKKYNGFIISLAEHNGSYSAVFKNLFDWISRIDRNVFKNKPVFLMATSPGMRGGITVLETAANTFPHLGASAVEKFSLPSFFENFKDDEIINLELKTDLINNLEKFRKSI
ncbi:MAG: NAD(P)H-dependent oxidoreductase [Polaribacter sp.]|nr:NAD(P)H-dependent oxidoreductase [Polaribacter sp.]MDG1811508.1 NAD(P)H-dependent oxidoreductase [Polaribacter sp.]MDG1993237.1 NAD(P)H-dependent oxidoreductase [Polaribacter sp.]